MTRTVYGSFMISSGNGASMMKLPLSDTTGPAFALAIRSDALGEPMRCRFCKIFVYAKGTTSMGMPCGNYRSRVKLASVYREGEEE